MLANSFLNPRRAGIRRVGELRSRHRKNRPDRKLRLDRLRDRRFRGADSAVCLDVRVVDRTRRRHGGEDTVASIAAQHDRAIPDGDVDAL